MKANTKAVLHAFAELSPWLDDFNRMAVTCPIPDEDKAFLALLISCKSLGMACKMMECTYPELQGQKLSVIAQKLFDRIIPMRDAEVDKRRH